MQRKVDYQLECGHHNRAAVLAHYYSITLIPYNKTYCCDPKEINGMINLDFDKNGKLLGIEIIGADKKLPESILKCAEKTVA